MISEYACPFLFCNRNNTIERILVLFHADNFMGVYCSYMQAVKLSDLHLLFAQSWMSFHNSLNINLHVVIFPFSVSWRTLNSCI